MPPRRMIFGVGSCEGEGKRVGVSADGDFELNC